MSRENRHTPIGSLSFNFSWFYTVFRASYSPEELEQALVRVIESGGSLEDVGLVSIKEPDKDPRITEAYEPLGLFEITSGDISGLMDSLLLQSICGHIVTHSINRKLS